MQYPIFIQNPRDSHFTASVIGIPGCVGEGSTEAEALGKVRVLLKEQLSKGKVVMIELPNSVNGNGKQSNPVEQMNPIIPKGNHSALPGFGMFKDDPTFDDFIERMAEYRAQFNTETAE